MFNTQFINDCALIEFRTLVCNLIGNANKNRPFLGTSKVQVSASILEDHRLERIDFTIVHDSKSIGAGPDVALF